VDFGYREKTTETTVKFNTVSLLQGVSADIVLVHTGLQEGWSQTPALLVTQEVELL